MRVSSLKHVLCDSVEEFPLRGRDCLCPQPNGGFPAIRYSAPDTCSIARDLILLCRPLFHDSVKTTFALHLSSVK